MYEYQYMSTKSSKKVVRKTPSNKVPKIP